MPTIDIECSMGYLVKTPTEFMIQIEVAHHPWQQILQESLTASPHLQLQHTESEQYHNRILRFSAPVGEVDICYSATVQVDMPFRNPSFSEMRIADLPSDVLPYLLPSRYCESDLLSAMAQRTFGQLPQGFNRVEAICEWIHTNIAYEAGSSKPSTTARDVLANRAGVCRDFAHLGVALCRALNIPARFVVGYSEFADPPPDFHALFEAYLEGQWVLFDATRLAPIEKLVRLGTGTDAKDVAFATIYGTVEMRYLRPLVCDHVEGQSPDFKHATHFIGSTNWCSRQS